MPATKLQPFFARLCLGYFTSPSIERIGIALWMGGRYEDIARWAHSPLRQGAAWHTACSFFLKCGLRNNNPYSTMRNCCADQRLHRMDQRISADDFYRLGLVFGSFTPRHSMDTVWSPPNKPSPLKRTRHGFWLDKQPRWISCRRRQTSLARSSRTSAQDIASSRISSNLQILVVMRLIQ